MRRIAGSRGGEAAWYPIVKGDYIGGWKVWPIKRGSTGSMWSFICPTVGVLIVLVC